MREIDTLVASLEELVAEVSSDRHQDDANITEEEQQAMLLEMETGDDDDDNDEEEDSNAATTPASNRRRRRLQGFGGRLRVGRPSWWTECKNIETTGCSFVLGYLLLSFVLMTTMFNMREIVGDYCLGNKERKDREHAANVMKAMELRRRSPRTADQEDRFEEEIEARLYYDKQGQLGDDTEYLKRHRVPIIRPSSDEIEDDSDDVLLLGLEP